MKIKLIRQEAWDEELTKSMFGKNAEGKLEKRILQEDDEEVGASGSADIKDIKRVPRYGILLGLLYYVLTDLARSLEDSACSG